ncbi:HNH endonuclease [Burkholderia cenocepacia]|uniref:HNH endonuclease n=1 Tax=Burkholderia cenocepacia TaxID=95486 RepID=UPI001B9306C2|nr:HNH endonuclease [Burkholderia cenocepacia]
MAHLERLKQFVAYDPETGRFHWLRNKARAKAGDEVGWIDEFGHRRMKFDGKMLLLHVVAWEMHNGPVPEGLEVDHRDGNPANNVLTNLRVATRSQNMQNMKMRASNKSGVKGVNWNKNHGRFQVQICLNRKKHHGGYFDTIEEAAVRVRELRAQVHRDFARHA